MFNKNELNELRINVNAIREMLEPRVNIIDSIDKKIDDKLSEFRKEMADKYFESLNNFIRWNKEMVLVQSLSNNGDKGLGRLKREIMSPFLKDKIDQDKAMKAEKVNEVLASKGGELLYELNQMKDEHLRLEREGNHQGAESLKKMIDLLSKSLGVPNA